MRNRFFIPALVFMLAGASLVLLLVYSDDNGSVPLTELSPPDRDIRRPVIGLDDLAQSVRDGGVWLASLELETLFYGVIGICGILVALRAIVSALRIAHEEYSLKTRTPVRADLVRAHETVIVKAAKPTPLRSGGPAQVVSGADNNSVPGRRRRRFISDRSWAKLTPYTHGLTGRMIISFTSIVMAFGLLTIAIVYFTLAGSLRRHAMQRARVTAVNVGDSVPGYLFKKNAQGMRELLRKHADRAEVAYIVVQNKAGAIFAHSFAVLPQELQNTSTVGIASSESVRSLRIGDGEVEEVTVPILEGQAGAVRLGIWRDEVDAEIRRTVTPLVKILSLVVGSGILIVIYFVWRINRPIIRLVRAAQMISRGDLEAPSLGTEDKTEFGELSRALERMRSSIKAALIRLHQEQ